MTMTNDLGELSDMKALVLAGGRGKRLDQLSADKNKCMVKVGDYPVIEYSLNCAASIDINEIIIVVGYRAEDIINRYGNSFKGKKVSYVIQWEQKGLVNAIECARTAIGKDDFILFLGDEVLLNPRHSKMIEEFKKGNAFVICGIVEVDDPSLIQKTYAVLQNENNEVFRLIEKPRKALNNFMGTGDCIFKNDIFKYINVTPIHYQRNEKELPDLIQCAIDDGKKVNSFIICSGYANINLQEDIIVAENFYVKEY